ncbi:MAG: hypothetical protein NTY51_06835 [Deltaproteobacteria bacterium]|nr:hypothetical protein [Deltaproteobacteria bacterium]
MRVALVLAMCCVSFAGLVYGLVSSEGPKYWVVEMDMFAGECHNTQQALFKQLRDKDFEGIQELIKQGKVTFFGRGDKICLIKRSLTFDKVKRDGDEKTWIVAHTTIRPFSK